MGIENLLDPKTPDKEVLRGFIKLILACAPGSGYTVTNNEEGRDLSTDEVEEMAAYLAAIILRRMQKPQSILQRAINLLDGRGRKR
ncbi:hypothetical protein [Entomobacter blattae]|uniref:Uncharacterized protein n=1 Tax=Entomobacter blattae TaxID=2762277 RepID=A0A7H1NTU4_9PROT|nr:hypothetical protein [Entomobacter blattae]QNT79204.1 hypothetical protein JGUZn3_19990 [Entomobacter blattae]